MKLTINHVKRCQRCVHLFFTGENGKFYDALTILSFDRTKRSKLKLKLLRKKECIFVKTNNCQFILINNGSKIYKYNLVRNLMEIDKLPEFDSYTNFELPKKLMSFKNLTDVSND